MRRLHDEAAIRYFNDRKAAREEPQVTQMPMAPALGEEDSAMFIVLYTILWFLATLCIFIFGFLVGRFARKIPLIDDAVPWTLHWGSIQPNDARRQIAREQIPQAPFWPTGSLWC